MVLFQQEDTAGSSRKLPFLIGTVLALSVFALFSWDLAHHWVAYSPHTPPNFFQRHRRAVAIINLALALFNLAFRSWLQRRRVRSGATGAMRNL